MAYQGISENIRPLMLHYALKLTGGHLHQRLHGTIHTPETQIRLQEQQSLVVRLQRGQLLVVR
jgi:hypothetical protein